MPKQPGIPLQLKSLFLSFKTQVREGNNRGREKDAYIRR